MKNPAVRCPKCFRSKRLKTVCPACKFREMPLQNGLYLPYRTHLSERYLTGLILGKSQTSVIYLAWDEEESEIIVLKEYFPRLLAERIRGGYVSSRSEQFIEGIKSFREEFQILQSLEHGNIVRSRALVETNGTIYISMDFCGYESLEARTSLPQEETLVLMSPVLDALEAVHASNLLHCDINPANIQLKSMGQPILLDFGSARSQDRRVESIRPLTFNPGYSAPEQHNKRLDQYRPWTDVYSCAATLYRLSTGIRPVPANIRILNDTLKDPILKNPSLTKPFSDAVMQGLSLDPYERPSISELKSLLSGKSSTSTEVTPQLGQTSIHAERIKRSLSAAIAPAIILFALVCAAIFLFCDYFKDQPETVSEIIHPSLRVRAADYYILRDVSLSLNETALDSIENVIRESIRTEDEDDGDSDFTSYAYFASWVTDGSPAQPKSLQAAARGDNIMIVKDRLSHLILPSDFRLRTNYKTVFDQTLGAIRASRINGDMNERKIIVAILTDGLPDQEGNLAPCLDPSNPEYSFFDSETLGSFEELAKSRATLLIILAGGIPNCATAIKGAWVRAQLSIPPPYRQNVNIVPLNGYEKNEAGMRRRLGDYLQQLKRAPMIAVKPAALQLKDDQRELFDAGKPFYVDFSFQPHFCDRIQIHISGAQIIDVNNKRHLANLTVIDKETFNIDAMGAPRNGEVETERIFFQAPRSFNPNKELLYQIRLNVEASSLGKKRSIPVVAEGDAAIKKSISTEMRTGRTGRLGFITICYALVASVFSTALALYWNFYTRSKFKRARYRMRLILINPLRYWLVGFLAIAAFLFVVSAKLISLSYMLWLVPTGFLLFKSRDLISKADRSQISGSDILLSCFDSILVPLAALLELLS